MKVRRFAWVLLAGAILPAEAQAQSLPDVLAAMRQGGGWIQIPILRGVGALKTTPMPAAGLRLQGCMEIYWGHSGRWQVEIEDTYGNGGLSADVAPGEDVLFDYQPGGFAQLDVKIQWSEPRDTTLTVWVGLGKSDGPRDPCEPVYGTPGDRR